MPRRSMKRTVKPDAETATAVEDAPEVENEETPDDNAPVLPKVDERKAKLIKELGLGDVVPVERTSTAIPEDEPKVLWRKIGRGSFRMNQGKIIIKQNQTFLARRNEIPQAFRDVVVPVDPQSVKDDVKPSSKPTYSVVVSQVEKGKYDVVNSESGKAINGRPLSTDEADNLFNLLSS